MAKSLYLRSLLFINLLIRRAIFSTSVLVDIDSKTLILLGLSRYGLGLKISKLSKKWSRSALFSVFSISIISQLKLDLSFL